MDFETLLPRPRPPRGDQVPGRLCARPASAVPQRPIRHRRCPDPQGQLDHQPAIGAPDALWEASEIVADIQEAYELAVAA